MRNNQSPSIYSIYQNALPYYLDRADLCAVDDDGEASAARWLGDLLALRLNAQVNASDLAAGKLRHLWFESKNLEKTHGSKTYGFGHPLLIDTHEGDLTVAPLFVWLLGVEPAQARVDSWIFKFGEGQPLLPNHQAFRHLQEKYDLDWLGKAQELASGKKMTPQALHDFCDELAARLHFENIRPEGGICPAPGIDEMGAFSESGTVHWSGVLSIFPPQHSRWRPGSQKPEEVFTSKEAVVVDVPFVFPFLPPNPEQASVLETAALKNMTVVESSSASAKSQVIVNLLLNALSLGQKCLVVSERVPALLHAQNLLSKSGLNQLHFLLDDELNDKLPMLELLRVAAASPAKPPPHSEADFQLKKNKYLREKAKVDAAYRAVKSQVFGECNWTETVGLFLASHRVEGKELLASQLNAQDFEYKLAEYEVLKRGILTCQPLFERVKTLSHPLRQLHEDVFLKNSAAASLRLVRHQLKEGLEKTSHLHHRYMAKSDAYSARLRAHYEQHFEQLSGQVQKLKEKMAGFGDTLGSDFKQAGTGGFRLAALFSSKRKSVRKAQEEVSKDYLALVKSWQERQYFDFQFQPSKDGFNIPKTAANLENFEAALHQWHGRLEAITQEEVAHLNSKTAHPDLDFKEQATELEYSLDVLLEELNEAKLYRTPFENKTMTIPLRQKYLEGVVEQLETTQLNLRDFDVFHPWQANWLRLPPLGQKVVRALVKVKPTDWMAAFESWYFSNLLAKEQKPFLPTDEALAANCAEAWAALKPLMLNQIMNLWQGRQGEELKNLKRKNKKGYQLIFEKQGHKQADEMPLSTILEHGFEAVSAFLPVIFATPHVALNVLPAQSGLFDLVVFDEANRLPVELATSAALLGKKVVICGSNEACGNETSVLQYAVENGVGSVSLTDRHRTDEGSSDPYAMQDEESLSTFGEFQVENVEGRFHELDGTNDVEAQHVIRLLNQVKQTPQRVFPSVGIATMTVEQRDLIASYLLRLKQQNALGSEKIQQLERNGMGVFHMDELYGQQFDILIVSCALGMVNTKGTLTKKNVFLNTPDGVSQLRMLVNRHFQKLFIVHSFPDEQLEKFLAKPSDEGTFLLAHLIRFIEALKSGNREELSASLEALGRKPSGKVAKSVFAQEVANALRPYVEEKRLARNVAVEDAVLPLVIREHEKNTVPTALLPDGFFGSAPFASAVWENQQREKIAKTGMRLLPVWSGSWFKNPGQEARLLASKIIRQDAEVGVIGVIGGLR